MGRPLRRIWWVHPWIWVAPLVIVVGVASTAVDVSDDFVAGMIRVPLIGLAGGLATSMASVVRAPLLLIGSAGRTHQPVFWGLTVTERLEVVDAMRAGRSPDDKRLAEAVVEVARSRPTADDLRSKRVVRQVVVTLVGAAGGVVLVWSGDRGLGTAVLLIVLLDAVTFSRQSRQEALMREQRDEALRAALPLLKRGQA
jgi:hypothetical protein